MTSADLSREMRSIFNGDGKADLAVANGTKVSVLLGTGTGGFGAANNFAVGGFPHSVISADFNGDGKADLATGNHYSSNVICFIRYRHR